LVTGEPGALPATKPVPVYAIEVIDGEVFLDLPAEPEP
jgi:nitrite reductase/ring-hydroxylating ferredoxin subunit